jgi:anthranilate phosphoribosyltransferase
MFAPLLHPAMKAVAPIRKELGFRTVFNLLGPLTNPAFATHQVIGVYDPELTEPIAEVATALGVKRICVVHNKSGLDELAPTGTNRVSTMNKGKASTEVIVPELLDLPKCSVGDLSGGDAVENARITRAIFSGENGARYNTVVLNAGLGLVVGEKAESITEGMRLAVALIDSGAALAKLDEFVAYTNQVSHAG